MASRGSLLVVFSVCMSVPALWAQTSPDSAPAAPQAPSDTPKPAVLTVEHRGDIAMARKEYRAAIDHYRQAPESAIILNKIGIAYHQQASLRLAKKYYNRAIRTNPGYSEAVNNLGTVYYAEKSYRRAVSQYKKALQLSPSSASVYSNLGTAYFARKQYKDAADAYQKAVSLDPEVFEHHSSYGVLMQSTNTEERAQFHFYLARTFAEAGMNDKAIQYIRKALEEGFKDRKKLVEEPAFAKLQELPEFKEVLAFEPRVL